MLPAGWWRAARGWLAAAAALPAAPGPGPPHGSSFCLPAGCCCCWLLPAAAAQPRPAGQRPARAKLVGAAGWARAWTPSSLTGTGLWKSTSIFGCNVQRESTSILECVQESFFSSHAFAPADSRVRVQSGGTAHRSPPLHRCCIAPPAERHCCSALLCCCLQLLLRRSPKQEAPRHTLTYRAMPTRHAVSAARGRWA